MSKFDELSVPSTSKKQILKFNIFLTLSLALILASAPFIFSLVSVSAKNSTQGGPDGEDFDGPVLSEETMLYAVSPSGDVFGEEGGNIFSEENIPELYIVKSATLLNSGSVSENGISGRNNGVLTYSVQDGDSLLRIASQFGISVNTLVWANGISKNSPLKNGEDLIILPVSGVLYESKPGDTVESISGSFGISAEEIARANNLSVPGEIMPGDKIIIPNGRPIRSLASIASESNDSLPSLPDFFVFPMPKGSLNWGISHPKNAVDIANVCGSNIIAAASGIVIKNGDPGSWNSGYGGYLVLEHQNGTETLYAHTQKNIVDVGDFVEQGQIIAKVGKTGKATGCHVHFEIHGAKNPFVKQ